MDIASMLEVQVQEVKGEVESKENVTPTELLPSTTNLTTPAFQEAHNYYRLMYGNDVSAVRFQRLHCTSCDVHIGSAPVDSSNMFEHPVLHTLLCAKCRDFYGDGNFEQGDDATDMFCRWCANGGNLYCCSFCSNTFCTKCIKRNFNPITIKKIEAEEKWKCFVCDPTDLYPARAVCWALLQHIQTINRLLVTSNKLSQEEIDERLNNDETRCCPRKRKRKRRRLSGSVSEDDEDDGTYVPSTHPPIKRRKRGRRARYANGSSISISEKNDDISEDSSFDNSDLLPSLLSCEQTMVECDDATVNVDGTIVSHTPTINSHRRILITNPQQPAAMIDLTANQSIFVSPSISSAAVSFPRNPRTSSVANQTHYSYQPSNSTLPPMVTIPNKNVNMVNTARLSLQEPRKPSVIEIESDPDDATVHTDSSKEKTAVPIALISSKDNFDSLRKLREDLNVKPLNERLFPLGKDINNIFLTLKKKFETFFTLVKADRRKKFEINIAHRLMKHLNRDIRQTVNQLACVNDRMIREYNKWKRCVSGEENNETTGARKRTRCSSKQIPLEMICAHESETESEFETDEHDKAEDDCTVLSPSDSVGFVNVLDGLIFFKRANTTDRAVGSDSVKSIEKSVQIYDVELHDYDKSIRQSTISKRVDEQATSYEDSFLQFLKEKRTTSESEVQDENSTNESEQKNLMETDSSDRNDESNSKGLKETELSDRKNVVETDSADRNDESDQKNLTETNSANQNAESDRQNLMEVDLSLVSEMLDTVNSSVVSNCDSSSVSAKRNSDSMVLETVNNLLDSVNDDSNKNTKADEFVGVQVKKEHSTVSDDVINKISSKLDDSNSNKVGIVVDSEDDCTIIDEIN